MEKVEAFPPEAGAMAERGAGRIPNRRGQRARPHITNHLATLQRPAIALSLGHAKRR